MKLRKAGERGFFDHGWLKTYHSFSFGDYHSEEWTNFQGLRVINEDYVAGDEGFSTHGHKNMEIFTYVLEGELAHKDSMGTGSIIKAGDFQYMSAGKGVLHSEFNPSKSETVHLLQIWIHPCEPGGQPRYGQLELEAHETKNRWRQVVTFDEDQTANKALIHTRAAAKIHVGKFSKGEASGPFSRPGVSHYFHCIEGEVDFYIKNEDSSETKVRLDPMSAIALNGDESFSYQVVSEQSHLLWFELFPS